METLSGWILGSLLFLAPPQEYSKLRNYSENSISMYYRYRSLAWAMSDVIKEAPLFPGPRGEKHTAALLLAIAHFESGAFHKDVQFGYRRGDLGKSWCLMQLNIGEGVVYFGPTEIRSWTGKDLVSDPKKCFRAGLELLRISIRDCYQYKGTAGVITKYTTGRCLPNERTAINRWKLAQKLVVERG